jgi:hypothetical protein
MSNVRLGVDGVGKDSNSGTHGVFMVCFRKQVGTIAPLYVFLKLFRENEELSRFQEKVLKEDLG